MRRFVAANNIDSLEKALQSGNMEESAHCAHTLKGVSANLSLNGIRAVSIDLEQAIKDGLDYSVHFVKLKQVYDATLEIIADMTK